MSDNTTIAFAVAAAMLLPDDQGMSHLLFEEVLAYYDAAKALKDEVDSQESLAQVLDYSVCALEIIRQMRRDFAHTAIVRSGRRKKLENCVKCMVDEIVKSHLRLKKQGER